VQRDPAFFFTFVQQEAVTCTLKVVNGLLVVSNEPLRTMRCIQFR
jgi:hypothetical protein